MASLAGLLGPLHHFIQHRTLTRVQEEVLPIVLTTDENVVVAAPTGSGKTLVMEAAMLRLFATRLVQDPTTLPPSLLSASSSSSSSSSVSGLHHLQQLKAVYVCPIKALAYEKCDAWRRMFSSLRVVLETGDHDRGRGEAESLDAVLAAHIIIATPERWDSITRRWREAAVLGLVNAVGLLLLDEIHTLREERGAALEAIVSRMKMIEASRGGAQHASTTTTTTTTWPRVRYMAVSATLPNVSDLATWLAVPPCGIFAFSARDRPVPLTLRVVSFANDSSRPYAFSRFLSYKLLHLIHQHGEGRPAMVFCPSRQDAALTAQQLSQDLQRAAHPSSLVPSAEVVALANRARDKQLRAHLLMGIAHHHAALTAEDRQLVEHMFREQYISILCTTTTLALGVNLPAHLVVVKGTTSFLHGQCVDLPLSEVMQMCGRAGRPGMDEHGVALILTTANKAHLYRACCGGGDGDGEGEGDAVLSTVVESQLHRHMIEHVNAEVSLGTIHSLHTAVMWAQTTFLWVRLGQHPQHYGLHFSSREEEQRFSPLAFVERLMRRVLGALVEERCIATIATDVPTQPQEKVWMEDEEGEEGAEVMPPSAPRTEDLLLPHTRLHPTRVGRCMARMYVLFATVHDLNQAVLAKCDGDGAPTNERQNQPPPPPPPPTTTTTSSSTTNTVEEGVAQPHRFQLRDALTLLSKCAELTEVRLRQGDRGPLNHINKSAKFALHSGRRGGREVREHWHKIFLLIQSLVAQQTMADISLRNDAMRVWAMVPRLARFLGEYARTTLSYSLILSTQMLQRCIDQRVWPDGLVLRQLHCVGEAAAKALDQGGFREVRRVRDVEACKMEALCGRPPPFGTLLLRELHALPTCRLDVVPSSATCHHVRLTAVPKQSTSAAAASCLGEEDGGDSGIHGRIRRGRFLLLVGHPHTDVLLLLRFIPVRRLMHDGNTFTSDADDVGVGVSFELTLPSSMSADEVGVHLLTPHFVGNDQSCSLRTAQECHVNHHVVGEHPSHSGGDVAAGATHHTEICGRATEEVAAEAAVEARQAFAELLHDFAYVEANHPRRRRRVAAGATHPRTPPSPSPAAQPTTSPLRDEVEVPCSPAATQDVPCITQEVMEERMMGMMMVPPMLCQSSDNVHNTDVRDVEEVGVGDDPDDDDDGHDVMVLGMNPPWKRSRAEEKAEVSEEGAQTTTTTSLHVKPADFGTCLEWEPSTLPPLSFSIPAAAPTRAAARPGPTHPRPPQPSPEPQPLPWRMLGQTPYNNRTTHGGFSSRPEASTTANPAQFGAQIATTHHPLATQHPPRTVVAQMAHTSPQPHMPSFTTTAIRNPYEPPPWLTHTYAAPPWMMMAPPPPPPPPREDVVWRRRSVPSWPYAHTTHATLQPWSQAQPAGPWGHAPPTSVPFSSSTDASHAAHPMSASYQHAPFTSAQQAAYSYFFHHHQHHHQHQHQPPTPW